MIKLLKAATESREFGFNPLFQTANTTSLADKEVSKEEAAAAVRSTDGDFDFQI